MSTQDDAAPLTPQAPIDKTPDLPEPEPYTPPPDPTPRELADARGLKVKQGATEAEVIAVLAAELAEQARMDAECRRQDTTSHGRPGPHHPMYAIESEPSPPGEE